MPASTAQQHGWRTRRPTTMLKDEARSEKETLLEADSHQEAVPSQWENLLVSRMAVYHLPAGVLERLITETLTAALPAIATLLERQLRFRIHREQQALRQACDDY